MTTFVHCPPVVSNRFNLHIRLSGNYSVTYSYLLFGVLGMDLPLLREAESHIPNIFGARHSPTIEICSHSPRYAEESVQLQFVSHFKRCAAHSCEMDFKIQFDEVRPTVLCGACGSDHLQGVGKGQSNQPHTQATTRSAQLHLMSCQAELDELNSARCSVKPSFASLDFRQNFLPMRAQSSLRALGFLPNYRQKRVHGLPEPVSGV